MSWQDGHGTIPAVPCTLNPHSLFHGGHFQKKARPGSSGFRARPYLGLRARLSQLWFNRWTVLLLLVLVRVLILCGSLNLNLDRARDKALTACSKVEDVGSAMASMPHYLSAGVNALAADGINSAVQGLLTLLDMTLATMEQMVIFIVSIYVGTYSCLIFNLIHVGLDAAVEVLQDATRFFNENIGKITGEIAETVGQFQNTVNAFGNSLETEVNKAKDSIQDAGETIKDGITAIFPRAIDIPTIDITSKLDGLKNLRINTTSAINGLKLVNETVPEWEDAKRAAEEAISIPFDRVRALLRNATSKWRFDKDIFPLAQRRTVSFCSENSVLDDFFDSLLELVASAKLALVVTVIVLSILVMLPMGYLDVRRWRRSKQSAQVLTAYGYDALDVVYIASRPHTAAAGIKLSRRLQGERQLLVRWAVAYATTPAALLVLSLAMAGFLSCLCQYGLLRAVQEQAPALAGQVGDFAADVARTIESVSLGWASEANEEIARLQDGINGDLFGWVREATTAVNTTLETVDQGINTVIDSVFGDVPLVHDSLRTVVYCVIGAKIETVEKGLTWVHDHARVSLPMLPNNLYSQGAQRSLEGGSEMRNFLTSPSAVTMDEITDAVDQVVTALRNSIVQEALISTGIFLVYVVIVLMAVVGALAGMAVTEGKTDLRSDAETHQDRPQSPRRSQSMSDVVLADEKRWDGMRREDDGDDGDSGLRLGRVKEVFRKISLRKTRQSSQAQVESTGD